MTLETRSKKRRFGVSTAEVVRESKNRSKLRQELIAWE